MTFKLKPKTYTTNTHNLEDLPIEKLGEGLLKFPEHKVHLINAFTETYSFKRKGNSWMLDQLVATFNRRFPAKKDGNKYSIKATLQDIRKDPYTWALLQIVTTLGSTNLVANQGEDPRYSALVPLFLASYKMYNNIGYEEWDREGFQYILHPKQAELLKTDLTRYKELEQKFLDNGGSLEELRLQLCSGKLPHKIYSPTLSNTIFSEFSKYFACMKLQLWVAAPATRHKYMILDLENLDNMPDPLVSSETLTLGSTNNELTALISSFAPTAKAPKKSSRTEEPIDETPPWM